MQKIVQEFLITVDQGVQFMRKCEHHMKVRGVNDLCSPLIYPDFLSYSLAVGAVPIPAGIVVDLRMSTDCTLADVTAEFSGFTVKDGMRSLFLNTGLVM